MPDSSSSNTKHSKKRKSSSRPTASALNPTLTNVSPEFLEKLKHSPRWQDIVDLICKELNLPGQSHMHGLIQRLVSIPRLRHSNRSPFPS